MHPAYFTVRFHVADSPPDWPEQFAIVTAYATTGVTWTPEQNATADAQLASWLQEQHLWHHRVTGYAPGTGHAEPGFAIGLELDAACTLGRDFAQDAIYVVQGDALFVTHCDARRALVPVGAFRSRIDGNMTDDARR